MGKAIARIANNIQRKLDKIGKPKLNEWIELHGLGRVRDPLYVVSVQLTFNALARVILYEKHIGKMENSIAFSDMGDEIAATLGNSALKPYELDELLDETLDLSERGELMENLSNIAAKYTKDDAANDRLGEVYEELIPSAERRRLGQFFTPIPIADLMVEYLLRNVKDGKVVDPAIGTGRFIIRLLLKDPLSHEKFKLVGIDISPLMLLLSAVNVSFFSDLKSTELRLGDMFEESEVIRDSEAIVSNPPYSRHHELSLNYKRKLQGKISSISGVALSGYTSFFGYVLIYLSTLLRKGGYMSFICPVEVFEAKYSDEIRDYLIRNRLLEKVVVFNENSFIFPYAENAASILFIHKDSPEDVYFIKVKRVPSLPSELEKLLDIASGGTFDWFFVKRVRANELSAVSDWKTYYASEEGMTVLLEEVVGNPLIVPFKCIAKIMRGIATGANDFFLLSDAEVKRWGIEKELLKPALAKTRWVPSYVYDAEMFNQIRLRGEKCWLLYCTLPPGALSDTNASKYIEYGEKLGLPSRSLIRIRRIWYQVERRESPPIVFTYLSRGRPRFIHNEVKAIPLNTFLCIYPVSEISRDERKLKALLAYLNSNIALELLKIKGRSYGGDTLKIEPRELDELPVLDVRELREEDADTLASLFDELKHMARGDEEVRRKIDNVIISILRKYLKPRKRTLVDYLGS